MVELALYARVNGKHEPVEKDGKNWKKNDKASYYEIRLPKEINPKRAWTNLGPNFQTALKHLSDAENLETLRRRGLDLPEAAPDTSTHIREAVDLHLGRIHREDSTLNQYRNTLHQFADFMHGLPLSSITVNRLRSFKDFLLKDGYAPKTLETRFTIIYSFLKKNGITARVPDDEMPVVDEKDAIPYTNEQLERLDAHMTQEQHERYEFFNGSACRDREVQYASWEDINWEDGTYHVCAKLDTGLVNKKGQPIIFKPKNHEDRKITLDDKLLGILKKRYTHRPHERWIFVSEAGKPDDHFLFKFKPIALRAGLNCGRCETVLDGKKVTCKTHPVCTQFILHRYRKTCATRWLRKGVDIRTIQYLLGHADLETTMLYLGVENGKELRDKINSPDPNAAPKRPHVVQQRKRAS